MTSFSGSVAYLKYIATSDKNGMLNKELNGVFGLGDMDENRMNYTAQAVVETAAGSEGANYVVSWTPVLNNKVQITLSDGSKVEKSVDESGKILEYTATTGDKIAYKYNQEYIPAKDIPSIGPKMVNIPLVAEPRRIAVKYDQITVFQAKADFGFSLDKQIAEQACGELAYKLIVA